MLVEVLGDYCQGRERREGICPRKYYANHPTRLAISLASRLEFLLVKAKCNFIVGFIFLQIMP